MASLADIPQTHLSSIASGKRGLGKDAASRLRPHVQLSAEDWVELLAPVDGEDAPAEVAGA